MNIYTVYIWITKYTASLVFTPRHYGDLETKHIIRNIVNVSHIFFSNRQLRNKDDRLNMHKQHKHRIHVQLSYLWSIMNQCTCVSQSYHPLCYLCERVNGAERLRIRPGSRGDHTAGVGACCECELTPFPRSCDLTSDL